MKTRSLILHHHKIRAALAGTLGLVVRPVIRPKTVPGIYTIAPEKISEPGMTWWQNPEFDRVGASQLCPLGVPGDRLCCRESYYIQDTHGQHREDGLRWGSWSGLPTTISPDGKRIVYYKEGFDRSAPCWRSPATMPAWASRITLEVVGVRCVRCNSITYEDAEKSGVADASLDTRGMSPLTVLRDTWTTKYGRRYPWETSWAWAVEVRRVEG